MTKWIRKIETPSDLPANQIRDAYTESSSDTYSCNYLNKSAITVISNNQYHTGAKWAVVQIKVNKANTVGNGFTSSGNYVVINKPMKGVLVSASLSLTNNSYSYSGDLYLNHRNTASGSEGHTANIKMCGTGGSVIIGANDVPSY